MCDLDAAVAELERARDAHLPLRIAFLNAHLANCAAGSAEVKDALAGFFILNDGLGIDLASRLLFGRAFPVNMNGTDFIPALLDRLRPGVRLYLLGGSRDVIERAAAFYRRRWPDHLLVGQHHGFFSNDEGALVASIIEAGRPDLLLVGMGCPRQELWLRTHVPAACRIGIGVGALFDFQTGRVRRAPAIVRRLRMEWLFRLLIEPRRLYRRYLFGNAVFLARTLVQRLRRDAPPDRPRPAG